MFDYSHCAAWPEELQKAEQEKYRLSLKIRCLEANIERADYDDFDRLMSELEATQQQINEVSLKVMELRYGYYRQQKNEE